MGEPSYLTVARSLRAKIVRGDLPSDRQLPTEVELAAQFDVSRQTVRRAYQDLVAEGLVVRERGRGSFAAAVTDGYIRQLGSIDDLMGLSEDTVMHVVAPLHEVSCAVSARRLRLDDDQVTELEFIRTHDGDKFCVTTVYLPPAVAVLLDDVPELHRAGARTTQTVIGLLDARLPHRISEAVQSIDVDSLPQAKAQVLGTQVGTPTLMVDRLYLDSRGNAVELAISHFLPEHYSYRIRLRRNSEARR